MYIFAVAFLFLFSTSFAQDSSGSFEEILAMTNERYGINQQLANGVYFEDVYHGAKGHPYMLADLFTEGEVTYFGKQYDKVILKYDLYAQELLISHQEEDLVFTSVLSKEFVDEFSVYGLFFRKMVLQEEEPTYYQVVDETDDLKCYYAWFRVRHESIRDNNTKLYSFSKDQQRRYLVVNGEVYRYFNNWTYARIFDRSLRRKIRSYLRTHDIKIQKATDEQVREAIQFSARLIQQFDQ